MKKTLRTLLCALLIAALAMSLALAEVPTADRAGHEIAIPTEVTKVISLAPSSTQVIADLGLTDLLIAVDTNSPAVVAETADLPQFDMMNPDVEKLAEMEPDIVFTSGMSYIESDPYAQLVDLGVCVIEIPSSESIAAVEEDVLFIAACLNAEEAGQKLVDDMQATIDEIAAIGATITEQKTVMFEIGALPYLYSFGSGTFLDEMIALIGAKNVLGDQQGWLSVTEEDAVAANPDVILTNVNYIEDPIGEILSRTGWENVTAIANGAVYSIDNNASSLPNNHIVDALIQMALAVYPDAYASFAE